MGDMRETIIPKLDDADLKKVLDRLDLPMPEKSDVYFSSTPILFLNQYGCTLRFNERAKIPLLRSDALLRPIGAVDVGPYRMELQPGGTLAHHMDAEMIVDRLDEQGIENNDVLGHERNCLYISGTENSAAPRGLPVCFDALYLRNHNPGIREFTPDAKNGVYNMAPAHGEEPDIQDRHYATLRHLFRDCFSGKNTSPDSAHWLWNAASLFKGHGALRAAWDEQITNVNDINVTRIGRSYAEKIEHAHFAQVLA